MENWIYALDDFLESLAKDRRSAKNAKEMAIIDCEIDDVRELRAFILGVIEGGKGSNHA